MRKEREAKYKEYAARLKREEDLQKVERELIIQKELRVCIATFPTDNEPKEIANLLFLSRKAQRRKLAWTSLACLSTNGEEIGKNNGYQKSCTFYIS